MDEKQELLPSEEIRRRLQEKAALLAELEARSPKPAPAPAEATPAPNASRITADGRTLAKLVSAAASADRRAMKSSETANADRIAAQDARRALEAYMRENGLA